jgi:hypothetical protein
MPKLTSLDSRAAALKALQTIPGIGPSLARDLMSLGISRVAQLKKKNPEALYRRLERQAGVHMDRCVLYVFRCAVYYAETKQPNPELLKWWNWKDSAQKTNKALVPPTTSIASATGAPIALETGSSTSDVRRI